jgi:hypothetical protein
VRKFTMLRETARHIEAVHSREYLSQLSIEELFHHSRRLRAVAKDEAAARAAAPAPAPRRMRLGGLFHRVADPIAEIDAGVAEAPAPPS